MPSVVRTRRVVSRPKSSAALIIVVVLAAFASAQTRPGSNAKIVEQTYAFPSPMQWKRGDVEISLIGIACGPADSPEMIARGREVQFREQPAFFPDRSYALALHFRAKRPDSPQNIATSSGLERITDPQGDYEYPWALTPSGFVQFTTGGIPGIWDVHFQTGNTDEYWDFFPVPPDQKEFLFQTPSPPNTPAVPFEFVLKDDRFAVLNASASKPLEFTREFIGAVGPDIKVGLRLTADGPTLSGTEQYAKVGKTLWLRGAADSLGNFKLTEYYPEDHPTGIFDGKFSRGYLEMTGFFAKPDGSDLQPFDFREVSTVDTGPVVDGARGPVPCPTTETPAGWKIYVNQKYGFCFSYPPIYAPAAKPWAVEHGDAQISRALRTAADEGRLFKLQNTQNPELLIDGMVGTEPFDLQSFVQQAPTGEEGPPDPTDIRGRTFYYYGPGGGGVCYPDQFFYDLRGKTLSISFAGPCVDDKTPTAATKAMEDKLLATFRTF